jgi:hypothetical protein
VKAQRPTLDFDPRYGADSGFWTTAMFIEAIYRDMAALNPPAPPAQNRNRTRNSRSGQ